MLDDYAYNNYLDMLSNEIGILESQRKELFNEFGNLKDREDVEALIDIEATLVGFYAEVKKIHREREMAMVAIGFPPKDKPRIIVEEIDPFDPTDTAPEIEEEYDEWQEQKDQENDLRYHF